MIMYSNYQILIHSYRTDRNISKFAGGQKNFSTIVTDRSEEQVESRESFFDLNPAPFYSFFNVSIK